MCSDTMCSDFGLFWQYTTYLARVLHIKKHYLSKWIFTCLLVSFSIAFDIWTNKQIISQMFIPHAFEAIASTSGWLIDWWIDILVVLTFETCARTSWRGCPSQLGLRYTSQDSLRKSCNKYQCKSCNYKYMNIYYKL